MWFPFVNIIVLFKRIELILSVSPRNGTSNSKALKKKGVKVGVTFGGWMDSKGEKYSEMVNDPTKRSNFVNSVVEFVKEHNFDGIGNI
jgi:GH18 family chitinase